MIKRRNFLKLMAAPAVMTAALPRFALAKEKVTYAYLLDPAYDAVTCMADPDNDMTIACRMADVWGRLRAEPTTGPLESIVAVLPFAWNDICAHYYWTGIENSPRLRATMAWIADHR